MFVAAALTEPDPSLGNEGQYAFQPTTGKTWVKSGGLWTYLGIYKAFQLKGAWSGATAYSVGDVVALSGSSYVCILDHTNHTPPNATYWQSLAERGTDGDDGAAATVAVGTVTTGVGGSAADVTNSGTSSAAVLDFTIPAGKGYGGTSTTSLAIGTGSKAFTTQSGLAYTNGARVRATATAGATGWLEGVVTYAGTTLTITSDKTSGSGTGTAWNFNVVGEPGAGDLSSANNLSDLTNAATAAENLGVVSYGAAQSLSGAEKAQAQSNVFKGPTTRVFTSGSGTYTTPANVLWIEIELVGGGGGGAGSGTSPGNGGSGGATTFGTGPLLSSGTAAGATGFVGGPGGSPSGGFVNKTGAAGGNGSGLTSTAGGFGANSPYGGAGVGGAPGAGAGVAAVANSGSGGGGGGVNATVNGGGGGGAGGFVRAIINSPSATYSYSVGTGGSAGTAGTSGAAGGAGGSGLIVITEYYGS